MIPLNTAVAEAKVEAAAATAGAAVAEARVEAPAAKVENKYSEQSMRE